MKRNKILCQRWLLLLTLFVVTTTIFLTFVGKQSFRPRRRLAFFDPRTVESKHRRDRQNMLNQNNLRDPSATNHRIMVASQQQQQQQQQQQTDIPITIKRSRDLYKHFLKSNNTAFCVPWYLNTDVWWTKNPEWEVYLEQDDVYCFRIIPSEEKRRFFRDLHQNQFPKDCPETLISHETSNAGWGADLDWYGSGLREGMAKQQPFQLVASNPWHYAAPSEAGKRNDGKPSMKHVCPAKDLTCYFLPLSYCGKVQKKDYIANQVQYSKNDILEPGRWYYDWIVSRKRFWLRQKVYELSKKQNIQEPCTVMHVRRGDTILAQGQRSYHSIAEYLAAGGQGVKKNIFLLTDDANAIQEASTHSEYNWMYVKRPRHAGSDGGWENHLPSNDATLEVVALLAELQLAERCQSLIRGPSTLADVLEGHIRSAHPTEDVAVYHIHDEGAPNNVETLKISTLYSSKTELSEDRPEESGLWYD